MKKTILTLTALAFILNSCNKSGKVTSIQWHLNGTTYTTEGLTPASNSSTNLLEADNPGSDLQIFFNHKPTADGYYNYAIVSEDKVANNTLGANEVAVQVSVGANDVYLSTGAPATNLQFKVSGGSITTFNLPSIRVVHFAGGPALDTTTISGEMDLL